MNWVKNVVLFAIFLGVLGLWTFYQFDANNNAISLGEAGDSFGSLNALFTGLAFVGLIWTISQQSEQLRAQQEELKLTREEIKNSATQLEGQKQAMEMQNFQAMFSNLINLHSNNLAGIEFKTDKGVKALHSLLGDFQNSCLTVEQAVNAGFDDEGGTISLENFKWMYWSNRNKIEPLINILVQIFLFIKNSNTSNQTKEEFLSLFFNFLSYEEFIFVEMYMAFINAYAKGNDTDVPTEILLAQKNIFYQSFDKHRGMDFLQFSNSEVEDWLN